MPALWYYLRGYVMIRITGFSVERFLNLASYHQILFWDTRYEGAALVLKTTLDAKAELAYYAEKTGCQMELISCGGLPVQIRRLCKRQFFAAGILCFVGMLYLLSSFVWEVDVEGNERLTKEEILQACAEYDLHPGSWKRRVDTKTVTKALLTEFSDISWVSVGIDGTDATIHIAETVVAPEMVDKTTPCDIIAEKDGLILQIVAERGTPQVQVGDVVQKGDVLISSSVLVGVEGEEQHTEYVAAAGAVQARTWERLTEELPLSDTKKIYGEQSEHNRLLLIGDWQMDFCKPHMTGSYDTEIQSLQPFGLGDWQSPLVLVTEEYKPYQMQEFTRTVDQAKAELETLCHEKAAALPEAEEVLEDTKVQYEVYADCVRAICTATLSEQIGLVQNIDHTDQIEDTENQENMNREDGTTENEPDRKSLTN